MVAAPVMCEDLTLLERFLDPQLLVSFTRCMCLLFVMELVRRIVQSWRNAFDDLRLVVASIAALIVLLLFSVKENTYSFPVISMALVAAAYIKFKESPWGLTFRQRMDIAAKDRRIGVATGLADVFFAFIENSWTGEQSQEAVEKYFDDNQLDSRYCNTDNLWPPLILFPDLTSDYYKEIFVDEEKNALVSGLVNAEKEERKAKESEAQVVAHCPKFHYEYDVKGVKRNSHYDVIRYDATHPRNNNMKISHYFSVIDNRPLNSLKMVGLSSTCEISLSREDFAMEVEKMKARLEELMADKSVECRTLTVKGRLSDVLRDLVKTPVAEVKNKAKEE